ncbi:MFS transporter [Actinoplanes awajinensis]|uniref:Major facilitator superfamily (MFS) profile domain-containing protein n=1 Tax=Actinoplanes awajinensis subsp. mycoplanecinus TaxID=135947 RepID=A0A101J8X7_9ACTN|nr:MFS transporter [Actinoplanes awajinensis]KUL22410.1 hypothetical protein ADL15_48645 [Actinoplanes awajinensis subsp. mycoplanecinus]
MAAGVLVVAGCLSPLLLGGLSSLLGELVPDDRARAFSFDAGTYGAAGIVGPALAAIVAGWAGAGWSMLALGGFVALGAGLFLTLPVPRRPAPVQRLRVRPLAGFAVMVRRRPLGAVTLASSVHMLGFGALPLAAAAIATTAGRPALTGLVLSALACGGLLGSVLCTRLPVVHRRPEPAVLVCCAAMAVPFLLTALGPPVWALLVLFALAGLFTGPVSVAVFTTRDREAPPELRTQVFTLGAGFKVTAASAGAAVGGLLASHPPAVLLSAIAGCQLLGAVLGALVLRTRNRPPRGAEGGATPGIRPSGSRSSTGAARWSSS